MQSGQGVMMPDLHRHATAGQEGEYDAFQMFILGELPHDRTLVGDGQGMGKEVVELFTRADGKLRVSLDPSLTGCMRSWRLSKSRMRYEV